MNKNAKVALAIAVIAVGAFLVYEYLKHKKKGVGTNAGQGSGVPQLGTNLNSIAPELIGGSTGPSAGPQVTIPVSINVTNPVGQGDGNAPSELEPSNNITPTGGVATARAAATPSASPPQELDQSVAPPVPAPLPKMKDDSKPSPKDKGGQK